MIGTPGTRAVPLGSRQIGAGAPCFIIAEAGVNHNGDVRLAHGLVEAAAAAGADAVKFQTFDPERLAAPSAPKAAYQRHATEAGQSQLDMLRALTLPRNAWLALRDDARARGLVFLSTPFDPGSADLLEALGVPAFKVPSGEITNFQLLAHLAAKGRPLLVSTGMSTLEEVEGAVAEIRRSGDPPVALFHCVTSYPAEPGDCNLAAMQTLRSTFGVPVGWSDHTEGIDVSIAAVALGAEVLEKHFTLDRTLPGPDHRASLEPAALAELVRAVRRAAAAVGHGRKVPAASEAPLALVARRSLHARRDLPAGHRLAADDVIALRPGDGLPPSALSRLLGRQLRVAIAAGAQLRERDLA